VARSPTYTREDHKALWEQWFQTRNLTECARRQGISIQTANRWKDDYQCPYHCPYHKYDELIHEVAKLQEARLQVINSGVNDPVVIDQAMRTQIANPNTGVRGLTESQRLEDAPAMEAIRKQDLIVGDYEFLYRKLYYLATGQALAPNIAITAANGDPIEINWANEYEKGLKINNLDKCIETLMHLRSEITKLTSPDGGRGGIVLEQTTETKRVTIPLEELAKMREHILKVKKEANIITDDA